MSEGGAPTQPGQSQMSASPRAAPSDPQTVPVQQAAPSQLRPPGATGAGPVTTTPAPPAYGDVVRNQMGQSVQPAQIRPVQYFQPTQVQPGQPVQYFQPGQPPVFYAQQPMVQPGGQQAFQYVTAPAPTQSVMAFPRPSYEGPHDFLFFSVIAMALCAVVNITSIAFGIPAIALSSVSRAEKSQGNYPSAQKYATAAVILNVCTIVWTLGWVCLATGLSVGSYYQNCHYEVYRGESTYYC